MKSALILSILVFVLSVAGSAVAAPQPATESEWITYLARFTGLQGRLSGPSTVNRYIHILSTPGYIGLTAEKPDFSSGMKVKKSFRKGKATQGTWLQAGPGGGLATYNFAIPNRRQYIVEATILGENQTWKIDDRTIEITGTGPDEFTRVRIGDATLEAGEHEISIALPSNGGVDEIDLITSAIPEIAPEKGFKPQNFLRYHLKAETMIRALDSLSLLSVMPAFYQLLQGEDFEECVGDWKISSDSSNGKPSGRGWLSSQGAKPAYRLEIPVAGIYLIKARMLGNQRLIGEFNQGKDKFFFPVTSPQQMNWEELGAFLLTPGEHFLELNLPSGTGVDVFEITRLADRPEDFLNLLFLLGFSEGTLDPDELPSGYTIEAEADWETAVPSGFKLEESKDKTEDANGITVSSTVKENQLILNIKPEQTSHYSILLRFKGEDSISFSIRDQENKLMDQRLVFSPFPQNLTWVPVVGNISLDNDQIYRINLSLPPGIAVDAVKLIPAIFPWEKLQELVNQEVYRESADKNLERMIRLFGEDVTTETGISPIEPDEDQEKDEDKEFGPASPSVPEPILNIK